MSVTLEELKNELYAWDGENSHLDVVTRDGIILEKLFLEAPISGRRENKFFYDLGADVGGKTAHGLIYRRRKKRIDDTVRLVGREVFDNTDCRGYTGFIDFGHTAPDYENVFELGLCGILERLERNAEREHTDKERLYYEAGIRVWRAVISYVERAADTACNKEQAEALHALAKRPPQTLYEAIQLTFVYYIMQHRFDGADVRTLGRLDALYEPFRVADVAAGRLDSDGVHKLIAAMYKELDEWKIGANIPFALGGVGKDGKTAVNEMSYILMEEYAKSAYPNIKLHFLYTDDMPKDFVKIALDSVRKGANSICFMGDKTVTESLIKLGEDATDARDYAVVGCYECGGRGEVTCSCNAKVNMPKAIELALNNGRDMLCERLLGVEGPDEPATFEDFLKLFFVQLESICNSAMALTNAHESQYKYIHSSPILSATYDACVESGRDVYCDGGAKYSNSSLNAFGMATAVDSLLAVKKLVYEDKTLTLGELAEIVKNDWEGNEKLRLTVKNHFPKYGMGFAEADRLAADIVEKLSGFVNGKPNVKGGIFRLGTFSINWRWEFGEKTAATPDGRKRGEPVSQNSTASIGADREGVTAHIMSATTQDFTLTPNGSTLDVDFHASAVCGEEGMEAMYAALITFMNRGGFAVHFNVLDASVLRKAMAKPEDYPNLQVRLCGWNVLFSNLSRSEQEEFVARFS